ncbi:acetyltransferase (GNAT) family protein [Actinokineospora spheciospongiae]|uniref:GNAT family N-acetyltransferase n=1 Tax=Actinokineospora spheciospongiae TaxID=909613 RepID=UPI000D71B81C|nr:GNAT family N-acetyltransferase [Actinokineospora spheciospongiae]PWW65397.1 acetyltransferase (GNAT) family protein [Actinokineospora spheciospongiae]
MGELEDVCARAWPAVVTRPLGRWLLRASGGYTGRANSALAVGPPGVPLPAALRAVVSFSAEHGIRPYVQAVVGDEVEAALPGLGWEVNLAHPKGAESAVLTSVLGPGPGWAPVGGTGVEVGGAGVEGSGVGAPGMGAPGVGQPDMGGPGAARPGAEGPGAGGSGGGAPGVGVARPRPGGGGSGAGAPEVGRPDVSGPGVGGPGVGGSGVGGSGVEVVGSPPPGWFELAVGGEPSAAQRAVLTSGPRVGFACLREGGAVVGVARGCVVDDHLHIAVLEVRSGHRRRGCARRLLAGLDAWAAAHGARRRVLQVATHNEGALALYRGLGYVESHRYRYWVPA